MTSARPPRRGSWPRRLGALATGVVAGLVLGALLADQGDDLLGRTLRGFRRPARPPRGARRPFVDGAPDRTPADAAPAEVEDRVVEAFRHDPILADRPIDIGAIGSGIVELTGWVDAEAEVRHATTLARGTIGVATVVNRLAIRQRPEAG